MKPQIHILLAAATMMASTADAAWQRIGGIDKRPTDIATNSIRDVRVYSSSGVGQPENLLSDDVATSSSLPSGASEVVIRFHRQADINQLGFINDGVEGKVAAFTSSDEKTWTALTQIVVSTADRQASSKFANVQARYLKLQFDLAKAGSVRSLSVFGTDTDRDFPIEDAPPESANTTNVAAGIGGTRIIYIHPSSTTGDDNSVNFNRFEFPESGERFRTVIYDLGKERTLAEVGSVNSSRPCRFYAYTWGANALPEKEDWRGHMTFDPSVFDSQEPNVVVEDTRGAGFIKAKFAKAVKARYVALRWEPDFNPPSFVVSGTSINVFTTGPSLFTPGGAGANGEAVNKDGEAKKDEGSGNASAGGAQGDAARSAVTNPFAFTSAGFGGTTGTVSSTRTPGVARARPRPRPRSA